MCRDTVSVSWEGDVYDCDFNQMLEMPVTGGGAGRESVKVWDLELEEFVGWPIRTASHCFGCTAGSGSSCGGALV